MWRKLLIINLVLMLGLHPVAQAVGPLVAPADAPGQMHESMIMDCGQVDPGHCKELESCGSGSHANCDAKSKSSMLLPQTANHPRGEVYASHPADRYLSHHAGILLRPPIKA